VPAVSLKTLMILAFALQVCSLNESRAESEVSETLTILEQSQEQKPRDNWPLELGVGYRLDFRKTVDASTYEPQSMPLLQIGVYRGRWLYSIDVFANKEQSESGNLKIEYERQSLDFWVTRMSHPEAQWTPFLGAGLGAYQDTIQTQFGNFNDTAISDAHINVSLKAGARFSFLNVLYSDLSLTLNKRETHSSVDWGSTLSLGFHL
jgi:hypothetical protein